MTKVASSFFGGAVPVGPVASTAQGAQGAQCSLTCTTQQLVCKQRC